MKKNKTGQQKYQVLDKRAKHYCGLEGRTTRHGGFSRIMGFYVQMIGKVGYSYIGPSEAVSTTTNLASFKFPSPSLPTAYSCLRASCN